MMRVGGSLRFSRKYLSSGIDLNNARAADLGVGKVLRQTPIVPFVDDRAVIRIGCKRRVEFRDGAGGELDEFVEPSLRQQHVVRCDTGLAAVEQLAVDDALDRARQICVVGEDAGRFAAQFQGHRR